ncbi:bacteriohemerythrin [Dechloromonas sp. XY25]|uniref:Bacteriohemerythrin n=1 Tax=Dechloromonas hankyongensis TaxID=2908002 RepID=A0ABS9K546_9RHOO|nr:bacteriohemerythrin [Dechloromonas hankyongensis]MCG2578294.1 bacteriohemerythrin [Dechloromonas hankyongensis]
MMNLVGKLVWQREYDTGVTEIDLQHRTLFRMFNKVNLELRDDSGRDVWEQAIHDLLGYALFHFWCEEDLATRYGYDQEKHADAIEHFNEHLAFAEAMNDMRSRLRTGERISKAALIDFLRDWLSRHVTDSDQWLLAFILDKQRQAGLHAIESAKRSAVHSSGECTAA